MDTFAVIFIVKVVLIIGGIMMSIYFLVADKLKRAFLTFVGTFLMCLLPTIVEYQPLDLYPREGDSRKVYIPAMRSTDKGDFGPLKRLIGEELIAF